MQIKLTKRQRDLLICDVVDVGADPDATEPAKSDELKLIADLLAGQEIEVTKFLYDSLLEFADRDADATEQQIYKRLLKKVSLSLNYHTHDFHYGCHKGKWGSRCGCGKWLFHGRGQPDLVSTLRQQSEQFAAKLKAANQ